MSGEAIGDPLTVARLQDMLGQALRGLAFPKKAIPQFTEARQTRSTLLGNDDRDTLTSMNNLGETYRADGQLDKALPLLEETLAGMKRVHGLDDPDTLICTVNLASAYLADGQLARALAYYKEARQSWKRNSARITRMRRARRTIWPQRTRKLISSPRPRHFTKSRWSGAVTSTVPTTYIL